MFFLKNSLKNSVCGVMRSFGCVVPSFDKFVQSCNHYYNQECNTVPSPATLPTSSPWVLSPSHHPSLGNRRSVFCPQHSAFTRVSEKWKHTYAGLASLTQRTDSGPHSCCYCFFQEFFLFTAGSYTALWMDHWCPSIIGTCRLLPAWGKLIGIRWSLHWWKGFCVNISSYFS